MIIDKKCPACGTKYTVPAEVHRGFGILDNGKRTMTRGVVVIVDHADRRSRCIWASDQTVLREYQRAGSA